MTTTLERLITTRDNLLAQIETESASPKPSYSIGGQSVSWTEWWTAMLANVEKLDKLISSAAHQGIVEVRQTVY